MAQQKKLTDKLQNEKLKPVIDTILQFGLTSHRIVQASAKIKEHQVSYAFNKLKELNVIAPLESSPVYVGKSGRSEKPYALTPYGASTLKQLGYQDAACLKLDGPLDVSHRFASALVASQDYPGKIEHVVRYAPDRFIRADVSVISVNGPCLIEIEQELDYNNRYRAVEKLAAYAELFASERPGALPILLIVFNLPASRLQKTLNIWQMALRDVGELAFSIHYTTLENFIENPNYGWDWEDTYEQLKPSEKKRKVDDTKNSEITLEGFCSPFDLYQHGLDVLDKWQFEIDEGAGEYLGLLSNLASGFYNLDFNPQNGQTALYGTKPVNSIGCLRAFLHDPRHAPLLSLMKNQVARFRKQSGVTTQMIVGVEMAWAFLGAFGLSVGGPLTVVLNTPLIGSNEQFKFKVLLENSGKLKGVQDNQAAIVWLLSTFIYFPRELGLLDESSRKNKSRSM
jgi:hypothetical protein